jgi:WD40 repeat protein/tRNA A-37 threonylcarbamoyl transferase component Bud32
MPLVDQHPQSEDLEAFALGRLDHSRFNEVDEHVAACSDCEAIVAQIPGDTFTSLLRSAQSKSDTLYSLASDATPVVPKSALGEATIAWTDGVDEECADLPAALVNHPRYRPLRRLGSGGMGAVWLAEHRIMGRQVAVKVIRPEFVAKAGAAERFHRETQAAARLHHPNIVTAFDAEQAGDTPILAMEYIDGACLADELRQNGPLPIVEACAAVRQAALGLQHAHERGLVHRDVKPQNLMRTTDGVVKVLDFGLVVLSDTSPEEGLTDGTVIMGTPDYIAPEQAEDARDADARSDIYSLGCTLYHLLTGRVPFVDDSALRKLDSHRKTLAEPVSKLRPEVSAELSAVVAKMMAKKAADRYQTAAEVDEALKPFVENPPQGTQTSQRKPPRRWAIAASLFFVGLIATAGVVFFIKTDNGTIEIQTDDENVKVIAEHNGKQVTVLDPKSKQTWVMDTGEWTIRLDGNPEGLKLDMPSKFTLRRGEKRVVTIRRVMDRLVVNPTTDVKVGEVRRFAWGGGQVMSVAFSPDGRWAVSGDEKGTVRFWDLRTGEQVRRLTDHRRQVQALAFSPDGTKVLSGGLDTVLRLSDAATGQEIRCFAGHKVGVLRAHFSPDGQHILSGDWEGGLRLWDVESGIDLLKLQGHTKAITGVAFSRDGKTAASGSSDDNTIRLWDLKTGKEVRRIDNATGVNEMAFSPDGRRLLSSHMDGTLRWWDTDTGKELRRFAVRTNTLQAVALSADGRWAITGGGFDATGGGWKNGTDFALRLWDVVDGKELYCFKGHENPIIVLALSRDGRYALTGSVDGTMRQWRLPDPPPPERVGEVRELTWPGGKQSVFYTAFSPDGRYLLAGGDHFSSTTAVWETATGKLVTTIPTSAGAVFLPDNRHILGSGQDGQLVLWDPVADKEVRRFNPHRSSKWPSVSADGTRAVSYGPADGDPMVLWDVTTGKPISELQAGHKGVFFARISPDGKRIATVGVDHRTVRLWDVPEKKAIKTWTSKDRAVIGLIHFRSDSRSFVIATEPDQGIVEFDEKTDAPNWLQHVPRSSAAASGISGDGRFALLSDGATTVTGYDIITRRQLGQVVLPTDVHGYIAVSADGRSGAAIGPRTGEIKGAPRIYLFRLGDPPPAEKVGEVRRFEGHEAPVRTVAYSPDGRHVLSGSGWPDGDKTVRLWDAATGKEIRKFEGHNDQVICVAFSPDSRRALTGGDPRIDLWDVQSGKVIRSFRGHTRDINSLAFSPDGRYALSGSADCTVRLWDVDTGNEVRKFEGHHGWITGVAFFADGRRAVSTDTDGPVRVWEVATGKQLRSYEGAPGVIGFSVACFPNGHLVAFVDKGAKVVLWDVETGKVVRTFGSGVSSVAVSPDGRRVLCGVGKMLQLWDVDSGQEVQRFEVHQDHIWSVAFSPDGRYAISGSDWTVRLWRLPDPWPNEKVGEVHRFESHKDYVSGIAVSRDGRYAVSGGGGKILGGQLVPGAKDYDIRIWDLEKRTEVRRLIRSQAPVYCVVLSPNGRRVLSGSSLPNNTIRLWDTETGKELKSVDRSESEGVAWSLAFSPDGQQVLAAASGGKDVYLLDAETLKEVKRFEGHTAGVRRAIFSPDGRRVVSASFDGTARLWDIQTGKELKKFEGHEKVVPAVAFSPDGRSVLTGGFDHTIRLWDVESGKEMKQFEGHKASVNSVAFSPDGRFALSAGGGNNVGDEEDFSLRLWDLESGKELHLFEGHKDCVQQVIWLPDGRHALSCSWDMTVRLWRLPELPKR